MLYWLSELSHYLNVLNLFKYITFRAAGASATALLFVFFFGPWMISVLRLKQGKGQPIREDGPPSHLTTKKGTPTMGGLMILAGTICSILLWARLSWPYGGYVWVVLFVTCGYGFIGFYDDYLKVTRQSHQGFAARNRLWMEGLIAFLACIMMTYIHQAFVDLKFSTTLIATQLTIPFFKDVVIDLGYFFLGFGAFVIVAAGNSVNLTDGLDGLAIVPAMIAAGTFALIAYVAGNTYFAHYLGVHYIPGAGELFVVCAAMIGAGLGFLWFNAPPAHIFMGDTGSLALGGLIGTVAVAIKHEIVLAIVGGVFLLETLSVMIQVISFKLTGKRVFKMAPIHHHFEQMGWSESQVVVRFWIIAFVLALMGLATLKIR